MTIALSVLDQSPVAADGDSARALSETVELARAVDPLGYRRYWVAEHHNSASFAGSAPIVLAAVLLQNTKHMRIGTGGVLLPRHDPRHVAEAFHVLADLHPGRVDLGLGRAGGPAETFPDKLSLLRRMLTQLRGTATAAAGPDVWLLGSGTTGAEIAGHHRLGYCFGHFLNPAMSRPALQTLRASSSTSPRMLAVRVFVAATTATAEAQAADYLLWRSRKDLGANEPLPTAGTAARHPWTAAERTRAAHNGQAVIVGDPGQVHDRLTALATVHDVDELMVNMLLPNLEDRIGAHRMLAEAFDLRQPSYAAR